MIVHGREYSSFHKCTNCNGFFETVEKRLYIEPSIDRHHVMCTRFADKIQR